MPGMNSGLNVSNPLVVAAFRSALVHQGLIALLIFVVLVIAWVSVREFLPVSAGAPASAQAASGRTAEPAGRKVLRTGFAELWIFDGILEAQPAMALGLPSKVIEPVAATSPRWVQQLVNWAGTTWSYHPVQAGASAVWTQVGAGSARPSPFSTGRPIQRGTVAGKPGTHEHYACATAPQKEVT